MNDSAEQEPTVTRPSLQPKNSFLSAAYLAWRLSEKLEEKPSGCWEWTGSKSDKGYATLFLKRTSWPETGILIHRVVYELCIGHIPADKCVLHQCDNPPCCRPDHLFLGTNTDNIADKVFKQRQARGQDVRTNHDHIKGEGVVSAVLTADKVMEIRRLDLEGEPYEDIARRFGVSSGTVREVATGRSWRHLPVLLTGSRRERVCPSCGVLFPTRAGIFYKHRKECPAATLPT